jgi:hypothetical protein
MRFLLTFALFSGFAIVNSAAIGQAPSNTTQSNIPGDPGVSLGGNQSTHMNLPSDNGNGTSGGTGIPVFSSSQPPTVGQVPHPLDCSQTSLSAKLEVTGQVLKFLLGDVAFQRYLNSEDSTDPQKQLSTRMTNIQKFIAGMNPHASH